MYFSGKMLWDTVRIMCDWYEPSTFTLPFINSYNISMTIVHLMIIVITINASQFYAGMLIAHYILYTAITIIHIAILLIK